MPDRTKILSNLASHRGANGSYTLSVRLSKYVHNRVGKTVTGLRREEQLLQCLALLKTIGSTSGQISQETEAVESDGTSRSGARRLQS